MGHRIRTTLSAIGVALVASATFATANPATANPATTSAAAPVARPAAPVAPGTVTATDEHYCDVTIAIVMQWTTGYGATVSVRNISTIPVRWTRLELRFPMPIWGLQVWNATYTQVGSVTTIVPSPSTGVLNPGESVMVAIFYASGSTNAPAPHLVTCAPL